MSNVPPSPPPPPPSQGYTETSVTERPPQNGLGIAALVVGILALLFAFFFFPLGGLLAIVAIILGAVGRGKAKRGEATNGGLATGGLVLGILALLVAILVAVVFGSLIADSVDEIRNCSDLPEAEQQACLEQQLEE